jgi:hypothetical protein
MMSKPRCLIHVQDKNGIQYHCESHASTRTLDIKTTQSTAPMLGAQRYTVPQLPVTTASAQGVSTQ